MQLQRLPKVIAICGLKRSGKDAIADHLVTRYGYRKLKFATPLKDMLRNLFGFTDAQLEETKDDLDVAWQVTPRKVMQFFGTEVFQEQLQTILPNVGHTFWARKLFRDHPLSSADRIVISDLRFPHEVDVISRASSENFCILRVERPGASEGHDHVSEMAHRSIEADYVITNAGDLDDLCARVDAVIEQMSV